MPTPEGSSDQGLPIDRPEQTSEAVTHNRSYRIQSVFLGGSQYGNDLTAAASENFAIPNRREKAQTWTDKQGHFWLFGGKQAQIYYQDLWEYDPATGIWLAIVTNDPEVPGARTGALTWLDDAGNLHIAGGESFAEGQRYLQRDHWNFVLSERKWLRVEDSNSDYLRIQAAIVNRAGMPTIFFGGYQIADSGSIHYFNDTWTLDKGGKSWSILHYSELNPFEPSARSGANLWLGTDGLLYLHAGFGVDAEGNEGHLNDLWVLDTKTQIWRNLWRPSLISACRIDLPEINGPLARAGATHWSDAAGNLWLFGGESLLACGTVTYLSDLWYFNSEKKIWSLVKKQREDPHSRYDFNSQAFGIGARSFASSWYDSTQDKLWIFGGFGFASEYLAGTLRDVWTLKLEMTL